jgi:hypothetical protein
MGGGRRKFPEVRKSANLGLRSETQAVAGEGGSSGGVIEVDLTKQLCERQRSLAFRIKPGTDLTRGEAIRVVRGTPAALVCGKKTVGHLSDSGQEQLVLACISAGYRLVGEIEAFDPALGEGLVTLSGFKT